MSNTTRDSRTRSVRHDRGATWAAVTVFCLAAFACQLAAAAPATDPRTIDMSTSHPLSQKQQAIGPIAATAATGDMPALNASLQRGLDAGLTLAEAKEVLVQLYAYAGFPRSLNALGEMMKVVEARTQRGVQDAPGREPGPVPVGRELLDVGTANQTKLSGAPVKGPLFDFAPPIDQFLKAHLFGDIFARDNLDWQSRELATVAALSAMSGVDSQLASHIRISMNVGLTAAQLDQFADVLANQGASEAAPRLKAGLQQHQSGPPKP